MTREEIERIIEKLETCANERAQSVGFYALESDRAYFAEGQINGYRHAVRMLREALDAASPKLTGGGALF